MATIVTRTANGSALSTAQMDLNLTNLNDDKIELTDLSVGTEAAASGDGGLAYNNSTGVFTYTPPTAAGIGALANVVEDTTPQLGGNLDVQSNSITTSTTNGNIELTPNGIGLVVANSNLKVTGGTISVDVADTSLNLLPGSGTAAVNIMGDNGLQIAGDGTDAYIFTATTNSNLTLYANGTGVIGIGSPVYIENNPITTSQTNGDITITPNGTGKLKVSTGIDVVGGGITTSTTNGNINITSNGTGIINLNSAVEVSELQAYAEKIEVLASVSGTLSIDATAGPIKYVVPGGNITVNGFSSPVAGQTVSMLIDQSTYSTSFTLTLGAGILVPGGTAPSLTATGNDLLTITCIDSVNGIYIANVVNNFS